MGFHVILGSGFNLVDNIQAILAVAHQYQKLVRKDEWNIVTVLLHLVLFEISPVFKGIVSIRDAILVPLLKNRVTDSKIKQPETVMHLRSPSFLTTNPLLNLLFTYKNIVLLSKPIALLVSPRFMWNFHIGNQVTGRQDVGVDALSDQFVG